MLFRSDETIFGELDAGAHGDEGSQLARDAAFWEVASRICADGTFDAAEQERMAAVFGDDRVTSLKDLLQHGSRSDAIGLIDERLRGKREELETAPIATRDRARSLVRSFEETT